MHEEEDNILVQRIRDGDIQAFRGIVKRHEKNIFYLGLRFFHNQEDAEDFTQDVFLKAFEKLHLFKGKVPLKGWLYKIAFNMAVNGYHLDRRRYLLLQKTGDIYRDERIPENRGDSIETGLIKKERIKEIQKILTQLPEVYTLVIKMHYYDGLKLKEIEEIMDVPLNTVKSYIHRAKKYIKKNLK
jgi:RNA polymerase sigma-70 factor (ECF subfamily)